MTKAAGNHLVSFAAGVLLTLSLIVGVKVEFWHWPSAGPLGLSEFQAAIPQISAASLAFAALAVGLTAVSVYYWRDAVGIASDALGRRRLQGSRSQSAQRLRSPGDVNAVREELERQLGRLIVMIAGQLQNSQEHIAALKEANAHLPLVTNVADLRDVIQSLISKNELNERETSDLEIRLKQAQDQAANLRQRLSQAEKLASLDPLTQVANRRRFEQFIGTEVERSHEEGTPLCLIMTDIDHFKSVNDSYGHTTGDEVLKAFAALLSKNVRSTDLVARYGGEEFALVLPRTPMGNAFEIAERVRASFQSKDSSNYSRTGVGALTASFGIAEIRDGEPPSALIERADKKLYEAKVGGRNRIAIWATGQQFAVSA